MTILPEPSSPIEQWSINDYQQRSAQSPAAAADGVIQVAFGPVPDNQLWRLERIVVSCTSSAATSCTLYLDYADPAHALDYTPAGNFDISDEAAPVQIPSGSQLLVVWTGASVGAVGTARAQWVQLLRTTG